VKKSKRKALNIELKIEGILRSVIILLNKQESVYHHVSSCMRNKIKFKKILEFKPSESSESSASSASSASSESSESSESINTGVNLLRPIHVRRLGWSAPTVFNSI
jgi:hypothetical protein